MTQISFYLLLLVGYIFFSLSVCSKNKYTELFYRILFILFFAYIASVRFSTVPDTENYIKHYNDVSTLALNDFGYYYFEPGYVILTKLHAKFIRGGISSFFFFITLINFLIIACSLKIVFDEKKVKQKQKHVNIALLYYASYYGLYFNFIVLRFGLGASFFVLALAFNKTKKMYSILSYVVSVFCHSSFIVFLPMYIFFTIGNPKRITKKSFYIWLFFIAMIYYFRLGRLFTMTSLQLIIKIGSIFSNYAYYLNHLAIGNSKIGIRFTMNLLLALIFVRYGQFEKKDFVIRLFIYFIGLTIYGLFSAIELIDRISDICLLVGVFLIPTLYASLKTLIDKIILYFPFCMANMIFAIRIINR